MFNVGDKVRIKSDLKIGRIYNEGCHFVSGMEVHKGRIATIVEVHRYDYQTRRYGLDIDNEYYFSDDMLETTSDSDSTFSYKIGDRVRIIDEMPEDKIGISDKTWMQLLARSGKIIDINATNSSYSVFILAIGKSFWFLPQYLKKEPTSTSENSIESVSKLIEYIPEIELSYYKKQIYTI